MRFAITAFNNKCVDAEEFNFEVDKNLLIICPNKGCCSPLTFIRTVDGQRYFRHPRRKQKELKDPNFQCEKRAKGITVKGMKTYNKIVEQTTLQQFQKNFYRVIANIHGWSEEAIVVGRRISTDMKFTRLMSKIYKKAIKERQSILINPENKDAIEESRNRIRNCSLVQILEYYKTIRRENKTITGMDVLLDPSTAIVAELAERICLTEKENAWELFSNPSDKFFENFPIQVYEHLNTFKNVAQMLLHENSINMRNFLMATYYCGEFLKIEEEFKKENPDTPYFPKEDATFNILMGEYLTTDKERKDRPLNIIFREAENKFSDMWGEYLSIFFPNQISNMLTDFTIDKYLAAVKLTEKEEIESSVKRENKFGFIYLAYNESLFKRGIDEEVKIGKTKSIPSRSSSYQTYSPDGFVFERTWSVNDISRAEKFIHQKLNRFRIKKSGGQEWFNLSVNVARQKIEELVLKYEKEYGYFEYQLSSGKGF